MRTTSSRPLHVAIALLLAWSMLFPPVRASAQDPGAPSMSAVGGEVLDSETGEPVIDAGVEVIGRKERARTDIDGKFSIKVPPGSYEIRVFAAGYQSARLTNITVDARQPASVDVALDPAGEAGVDTVEVVAEAKKSTEAAQILERQKADVVSDTVSSEVFKKAPDSNAAEVVQRVSAVTVEDDFVYVRGLGERYSSAVLNGSRLPSPNPDKRVIPLDFFPATFIDSLAIIKSYTPNLEGDFSGGLIDINLLSFPETFTWKVESGVGFNTNTTFGDFKTYKTAREAPDFFGIDTSRALPGVFGDERVVFQSQDQAAMFAAALKDIWSPQNITAPPNTSVSFQTGNQWGPFGFSIAGLWNNDYQVTPNQIQRQFINVGSPDDPVPELGEDFVYDFSVFGTELGGLLTSEYDIDDRNELNVRGLYQRMTADSVQEGSGFRRQNPDVNLDVTRLEYQEESLAFGQLGGEHQLFEDMEINWRSAFAQTVLDRPDTRTTVYETSAEVTTPQFARTAGSGTRLFLNVEELMSDTQVDFIFPFETGLPFTDVWEGLPATFSVGGAYTWRDRDSNLRRFLFRPRRTDDTAFLQQRPELILNSDNVFAGIVDFTEDTTNQDSFEASEEVVGGYAMVELPLIKEKLRFVGGIRGENSLIDITFYRQDQQGAADNKTLANVDPMPSANFIWSPRSDMNVRAGYSQTVSRPEFRELSPIQFPEPFGLRPVVGNPDLVESHIDSIDLRWEWFFSALELVSTSFFYKNIDKPIETILRSLAGTTATSFANSESAYLYGLEWEARKDFGFVDDEWRNLVFFLNASWIDSESERGNKDEREVQTRSKGPLQGQAPFIVNAALQYGLPEWGTARLIYNTIGERLSDLGEDGLPDIFEQPRNQLDFTYSNRFDVYGVPLDAKFAVENILNDSYLWTQSGIVQQEFRTGATFTVKLSYTY